MNLKIATIMFISLIFSGCGKIVYYNTSEEVPFNKKSILLLQTTGNQFLGLKGLTVKSINEIKTDNNYSNSKIELTPGRYDIEFSIQGQAGMGDAFVLGMAGGTAAINTYMYGVNRTTDKSNKYTIDMKAGHIYFASYTIDEKNNYLISIEEL
jgi:hypothetical protein